MTAGQDLQQVKEGSLLEVFWKKFQTAKVLIMERPSVELAVIFVVRSSLTTGPLLQ